MVSDQILKNYFNGEFVASSGTGTLDLINPIDESVVGTSPISSAADIDAAFAAAAKAFKTWGKTTPKTRQTALLRLADAIEANSETLVAAQVTPWNYPLMMALWTIGPAIAAGNTVVLKPSDTTPESTLVLAEITEEILPDGVFNVVLGNGATGAALVGHKAPSMVSITGSVRAGIAAAVSAAQNLKRAHLELGGKAPAVVFADADLDKAVDGTTVPPLNNINHFTKVLTILDSIPPHATVATDGKRKGNKGFYVEPTVITGVHRNDSLVQKETFGPVVTVQPLDDESQALELSNDVSYGLASSIWTSDNATAGRMTAGVRSRTVTTTPNPNPQKDFAVADINTSDPIAPYRELLGTIPAGLWIGGKSVASSTKETFSVDDPATGTSLLQIADATPDDANTALESALTVAEEWADTAPRTRSEILRSTFDLVRKHADDMAMIMTLEMGKALPDSTAEINYGGEFLRWFAEETVRIAGRFTQSPAGSGRIIVTHAPVGVALAITPWNFPLAMGTRKIGPALAAGCTMLVKPAQETPLTMLYLAKLLGEAGLPGGVLSVLPTSKAADVTGPLIADPRVRKISFTGSTPVGRTLLGQAADNVQRTSMELGGNAPFLVFDDADVELAVEGAFAAKTRNGGEACTAANRFLVQDGIAEEFTAALTAEMQAMVLGRGYDSDTTLGPMVNAKQQASIAKAVADAVAGGARVRLGADPADDPGCYYPATVLDEVPADAAIVKNEIFGPVAAISTFSDEGEAIDAANATEFGLAAYLYTQDLDRALRVADKIESGMVGINRGVISDVAAPFGGVKQSGIGREGGSEGIYEYLTTKYIALT